MTISVLLRLVDDELAAGRLVGEAQLVESGTVAIFRSIGELMDLLRAPSASGNGSSRDDA